MAKLGYNTTTGQGDVSNYEIASAIGAGSLDIGTLCTHENVNKWSRIKPLALMSDDDTPNELEESDFRGYKEGVYSKPYGLFPKQGTIGQYDFGGIDFTKEEEADMKAETEWEYSQPKALDDRVVNGEGREIYAREPDFCGYDHNADPPIKVEWLEENNGVKGVYAKVTLNVNNDATYGGVKMSDFMDVNTSTGGFFVSMLCISNKDVHVPELNADRYRYAFGYSGMSVTLKDSSPSAIIGMHNGMLSPLDGETYNFVVVVNNYAVPAYDVYANDGWTEWRVLDYYPKITNYAAISKSIILENGVMRKSINDITGTTLFMTGKNVKYSEVYNELNVTESASRGFTFTDNASGGYGVSVKVTEAITSKKRVLVMKSAEYGGPNSDYSYFNYIQVAGGDATGGGDKKGIKPLLTDLPMTGTTNRASFYLNFQSSNLVTFEFQVTSANGNILKSGSPMSTTYDCVDNAIKGVIFENILDTKKNVTGLKVTIFKGEFSSTLETGFTSVSTIPSDDDGNQPYLPSSEGVDNSIANYGSFHIALPSVLPTGYSANVLGGSMKVDYGIYDATNTHLGGFFIEGDKLNQ